MHKYSVLILYFCWAIVRGEQPQVTLPSGVIRGHFLKTLYGREFQAFEGIPYAQPPIGENRFKEAQPKKPWTGVWEATKLYKCMQFNHYNLQTDDDIVSGEEDCLYVNVYKPKLKTDAKILNVIVFIHGGWFTYGSGGPYGPQILLERDVIYITFNYRLGPLGFLSTEDEVVPGNLGMKDQVLALKWIKDNIKYFSGNPDSITISGLSAGGASVHLHILSPLSKGLFTRGISQSGHAFDSWVLTEGSAEKAKIIAANVGCTTNSSQSMINCLRQRPARNIVDSVKLLKPWMFNPVAPFAIVVDKHAKEPFLPEHPYTLIKSGKINDLPWIVSHTSAEGLDPAADFMSDPKCLNDLEQKWNEIMPYTLQYNYTAEPSVHDQISKSIKEYYFKGKPVSEATYSELVQLIGDRLFVTESARVAKEHSAAIKSPVYYYYFTYRGAHSMSELGAQNNNDYGSSHGDDTITIISTRFESLTTENDRRMSKLMVDMWMSFTKMSIPYLPNVDWTPVSKNKDELLNYVEISSPNDIKAKTTKHFGHYEFWTTLNFKELNNLCSDKDEL